MIRDETVEVVDSFLFLGAKIERDGGRRLHPAHQKLSRGLGWASGDDRSS